MLSTRPQVESKWLFFKGYRQYLLLLAKTAFRHKVTQKGYPLMPQITFLTFLTAPFPPPQPPSPLANAE